MYHKQIPVFLRLFPAMLAALFATALLPLLSGTTALAIASSCGKWQIISSPNTSLQWNSLNSVAAISATDVWAVGYYISPQQNFPRLTLVEQWNGTKWNVVKSPNAGKQFSSYDDFFNGATQVPGTTQMWAVGYYVAPPPDIYTLTEYYC